MIAIICLTIDPSFLIFVPYNDSGILNMELHQIYKKYPAKKDCIHFLESVRWNNIPVCPYCNSTNSTAHKDGIRSHCNNCNTSFSVTTQTMFHKTKVELQKWFYSILIFNTSLGKISVRKLSKNIQVNKNTSYYIIDRIKKSIIDDKYLLDKIMEKI